MVRKSSTKTKIFWFQKIQTKTKPHWNRTEKLNLVQPVLASFFGSSVFCTPLAASYSLLEFMQSRILWDEMSDTLCWCLKEDGKFDTQSFNHAIRGVRILCFLGRVFGNQRFLSEWLSLCGQLLMVGFLLWIISYLGVILWQISVVVSMWWWVRGPPPSSLSCYIYFMDFYASEFRYSLGYVRIGGGIIILLASMVWEYISNIRS